MNSGFVPAVARAFDIVFQPWMNRWVEPVLFAGIPDRLPEGRPLFLVANHLSWWDGFVLRQLQRIIRPGVPFLFPMSRAELRRFPFFRLLGAIPIDRDSTASVLHAVRALTAELERRPGSVVAFFPQGRIWPSFRRPLGFERGISLFAERAKALVLPVGMHAEPLNRVRQTFFVSVGEAMDGVPSVAHLERSVETEIDAILHHLTVYGEDVFAVWSGGARRLDRAPGGVAWHS